MNKLPKTELFDLFKTLKRLKSYLAIITGSSLHLALKIMALCTMGRKRLIFCEIFYNRIGHLACDTALFLRKLKIGGYYDKKNIYVGISPDINRSCNIQLMKMFKRQFPIINNTFLWMIIKTLKKIKSDFYIQFPSHDRAFGHCDYKPVLSFTKEEEKKGRKLLAEMGIGEDDWFVCFGARDTAYLNNEKGLKGANWDYHNYRNSDINNCLKAAEYIAEQGGYAIRMGSIVEKPLPRKRHPGIIDYATDFRNDFMDIYLIAHCKFFFGASCGIVNASAIFGTPVAYINMVLYEFCGLLKKDLFIVKKIHSTKNKRHLTYKEIFDSGISGFQNSEDYIKNDLRLTENTPDEILNLVMEMNYRLNGTFKTTKEDEILQNRYRSFYKPRHLCYGTHSRMGTKFLQKNKDLLE